MREFLKQRNAGFTPEAVEVLVAGFDDAWAVMKVADGVTPENVESKRQELGRVAIELAVQGVESREALCKSALAYFGLLPQIQLN